MACSRVHGAKVHPCGAWQAEICSELSPHYRGMEIVFNQQLPRLGQTSSSTALPHAQSMSVGGRVGCDPGAVQEPASVGCGSRVACGWVPCQLAVLTEHELWSLRLAACSSGLHAEGWERGGGLRVHAVPSMSRQAPPSRDTLRLLTLCWWEVHVGTCAGAQAAADRLHAKVRLEGATGGPAPQA